LTLNRKNLARSLIAIVLMVLCVNFLVASKHSNEEYVRFGLIRNGMTVREVFELLDHDIDKCNHLSELIGLAIDYYSFRSDYWKSPRYEFSLVFVSGELQNSSVREVCVQESFQELWDWVKTFRP
jgi:hypothetical protein